MDNVEWHPFFYNGLETNIEVTRCGRVRRLLKDWYDRSTKRSTLYGELDLKNITLAKGYIRMSVSVKNLKIRNCGVHQMVASVFLNHIINGHRLVVDHIDSNTLNNHVDNLRVVTQRENASKERTVKSGLPTGVVYRKKYKKYVAHISIEASFRYLGCYSNVEEASKVYQCALKELNQFLQDTDNEGDQNEWFILYSEKNKIKRLKVHSLPRGVSFISKTKSFRARIYINNHAMRLGNYERSEDAHKAYKEAKSSLDRWLLENKDLNDWVQEYRNKIKMGIKDRKEANKLIKKAQNIKEATSNIGEQLAIQFN